jgi:exopolyphosphatase / guanosine-5'-triphosphate,3'-diphosphate pyrophosphatase
MSEYSTLAAVDLGSNSFHLQVARVAGDQIYPLDALRAPLRIGAGLTPDKRLDEPAQQRAIDCLRHFGERLRGFDRHAVRAVGTNTLRVAKNAHAFLKNAEAALGFPIEVVAGREEARLIYLGVSHSLPLSSERRLVVDIGGGSTELIIGRGHKPLRLESLYIGCVSLSIRYFPDGKVTKTAMKEAEDAARIELQPIIVSHARGNWDHAVGSSGTARGLAEICQINGFGDGSLTSESLDQLRAHMVKAGNMARLELAGLREDRLPVLPGGLAIMSAVLAELKIPRMAIASGAMRQGILYDLLGRFHHRDMRDMAASQLMQRYHVDAQQARRVGVLAATLYESFCGDSAPEERMPRLIARAAKLHEIGISVAYSGYNRHSAYIIQNADMPGFSKAEQFELGLLVLAHRRSLKKVLPQIDGNVDWQAVMALRLAALMHRSRNDAPLPEISARAKGRIFRVKVDRAWLENNPLTVSALRQEVVEWDAIGFGLEIKALDEIEHGNGVELTG